MAVLEENVWVSSLPATPEARARAAMKFVRVALVDGYLTDISISMLLVELKRSGVEILHMSDYRSDGAQRWQP